MIVDVKIPQLPESVPDATLLEWSKQVGDIVAQDEVLVELETDKVVLEVSAPQGGKLTEIVKQAGETAVSDEVIARLDTSAAGEAAPTPAPAPAAETSADPAADEAQLSPAVRKLVDDHQLDPASITASGPGGRLTKGDVLAHIEQSGAQSPAPTQTSTPSPPVPATAGERGERRVPMTRLRQRIAERLLQAQQTAAILTTFNEVNMQPVMDLRKRLRDDFEKTHGVRLGFMSFFAKAAVQALKAFPAVNAYIEGTDIVYHDYYDIGVAVGSPRGLVVPVVRDVDQLSFAGVEGAIAEYGQRAQAGTLGIDELTGGTFTISNGGVFGSMLSTPILNPPQSAILGMHATQMRPVVEDGEIVARPMMYLALSYDHRIIDGREAVQFLVTIKQNIEDPGRLLLGV
ncbi:MAG: 2-oxoglutarate dehydrogenase complex dihydrolipoyllysine-residue succinyltransferase [Pseudomonadota bacterium]